MPSKRSNTDKSGLARLTSGLGRLGYAIYGIGAADLAAAPEQTIQLQGDEIAAQMDAIRREIPIRLISVALLVGLFLLYIPAGGVVAWFVVLMLCDHLERLLFSEPQRGPGWPRRHAAALFTVFTGEFCFSLPSGLIWQSEDPFSKAISVGVMAAAMMRLSTIRSIYPATGLSGVAALALVIANANSYYWVHKGDMVGLAVTSVIAVVSIGYAAGAIIQNHRQQRLAALGRMALQRASAAKSAFLSQMSHELRTPLNAIIGIGTAALLSSPDERMKEQMGVLVKSAKGLGVVLDDVLDMAAIEEGRINLHLRVADLREELAQTVALFRPQAAEAGLDLRLEFSESVPTVARLDFDRLRQCISNLLSNALKHTGAGHVLLRAEFAAPNVLHLAVEDTGTGIPPGMEETIFNRYERGSEDGRGYGLGLTICRSILRRMGGDIFATPSRAGAIFRLWLPLDLTVEVAPSPGLPTVAPHLPGRRVLVVDDVATNRLVAVTYLNLLNCSALEAVSGAEALEILGAGQRIDLILLDINMPQMDGLTTLRSIRNLPQKRALPIVAMTADASDRERRLYLEAGMDGYVSKPIDLERLAAEIARLLATDRPETA